MKTWMNAELKELSFNQTQFDYEQYLPSRGETLNVGEWKMTKKDNIKGQGRTYEKDGMKCIYDFNWLYWEWQLNDKSSYGCPEHPTASMPM